MTTLHALDAVDADIRDHRITVDGTGLFNVMRHIDLLCHLTARMAADAEYQRAPNVRDLPPAKALGASAGHLGQAIAHYTQALAPLITLTTAAQDTRQQKLDALGHHSSLRIHLDGAGRVLAAAPHRAGSAAAPACRGPTRPGPAARLDGPAARVTTPPDEGLLFEVPTPVEQLLRLAGECTRHNDAIDVLLSAGAGADSVAHAASARTLAHDTHGALRAIRDQRLNSSMELAHAQIRLRQLGFLSAVSADYDPAAARELTALATDTVMDSARVVALQMLRRAPTGQRAPAARLTTIQHSALEQIARGHVVANSSLGREYTRSREPKVSMSILRSLEAESLAERAPATACPAYHGGPLQDRVRLTPAGIATLATVLARSAPQQNTGPSATAVPLPAATPATAKYR